MPTQIPQGTGTLIGNMTASGGLAAAFDGVTSQTQAASSALNPSGSGFNNTVGKDWGAGVTKTVTQFSLWGPNNSGIVNTIDTTVKLQGSQNNSAWVDLYTSATLTGSGSSGYTTTVNSGIDMSTAYRYHRLNFNGNGVNQSSVAEVQFFEPSASSLTADAGTFTLTGIAARIGRGYALVAAAGSYVLTGIAAARKLTLISAGGAYTLTGNAAGKLLSMAANTGSYILTGNPVAKAMRMAASAGAYVVTGIVLEVVRWVAPDSKFKRRLADFVLQKRRVNPPQLED